MSDPPRIVCVGGTVRTGSNEQALRMAAERVEDQGGMARVLGRSGAL